VELWNQIINTTATKNIGELGVAFVVIRDDKPEQSLEQHFAHEKARKESVLMMDGRRQLPHTCSCDGRRSRNATT
jgi:hypothetical protein